MQNSGGLALAETGRSGRKPHTKGPVGEVRPSAWVQALKRQAPTPTRLPITIGGGFTLWVKVISLGPSRTLHTPPLSQAFVPKAQVTAQAQNLHQIWKHST